MMRDIDDLADDPWFVWINGVRCTVTKPNDPAQALLQNPNIYSTPDLGIYRENCYICVDPEFAAMGMPLCKPCVVCKTGHVAADDTICDDCGEDQYEAWTSQEGE